MIRFSLYRTCRSQVRCFATDSKFIERLHGRNDKYFNKDVEMDVYNWWEREGYFKPSDIPNNSKPIYTITMPPPNVTGSLHMGHALFVTIQDIFIRYRRMCGYNVLWLPGTDHAGIATQMVVEKQIERESKGKITRKTLGREKFVNEVWKWKHSTGDYIIKQLR